MTWECLVGVFRGATMSNPCRRFHTTSDPFGTKPLIRLAGGDVAEGRHVTGPGTRSRIDQGYREGTGCIAVVIATRVT